MTEYNHENAVFLNTHVQDNTDPDTIKAGIEANVTAPTIPQEEPETLHDVKVRERRQKLIEKILQGKTISQIAKEIGVDRTTLYRDFDDWIKTDECQYIHTEWLRLYQQLKTENPEKAFDGLTKLLSMYVKKEPEINVNVDVTQKTSNTANLIVNIEDYSPDEVNTILEARRTINKKLGGAAKPYSIH
jgi:hypothetical protein